MLRKKLQCAFLLNEWMTMYLKLRPKQRNTIVPVPDESRSRYFGVPMVLAWKFLDRFATSTVQADQGNAGFVMSQANSDSCVVHLFLLYLMAEYHNNNNKLNATVLQSSNAQPLADDVQLDGSDVAKLLRQAGCTVTHKRAATAPSGKTTAAALEVVLKTPLTFPKSQRATGAGTARR